MKLPILFLALLSIANASAQDPWPLERQDRWGTGRAPVGPDPATFTTPWIFKTLNSQSPVSHPPSLGADGLGYFGTWVNNLVIKFVPGTGAITGAFNGLGFVTSTPAISPGGSHVYAHVDLDNLYRIDTSTMDYDWFFHTGGYSGSAVLGPEGDVAISSSTGNAWRFNALTGIPVWTRPGLQPADRTVVFSRDDALLFVANGTRMSGLDWGTGAVVWTFDTGSTTGGPGVAPNGTVVFGNSAGWVYGLNPANGAVIWSKQVIDRVQGAPAFSSDGVAYVASYDFRLYAFRVTDGFKLWSFTGNHANTTAPSVGHDGRIYFYNYIGWLYCLAPNGTPIWIRNFNNGGARGGISIDADGTLYLGANAQGYGMTIIKQRAIALAFDSLTMEIGTLLSGTTAQLVASDNQYVNMQSIQPYNRSDPQARARLELTSPYTRLSKFTLKFEAQCSAGSLVEQRVELFDFTTGSYETVDLRPATSIDSAWEVTVSTNAGRFVQSGTGLMKLRAGWKISTTRNLWTARMDQATLVNVVPEW